MSEVTLNGSAVGTELQNLLIADSIQPGSEASYQICKTIYLYHPLGAKMAESPIKKAQSQAREITVPGSPNERVVEQFMEEWKRLEADKHIYNVMRLSRIYGVASVAILAKGVPPDRPITPSALPDLEISFNVYDPLNTAGSLVLSQDPNAADFQKHTNIVVNGTPYHRSRACIIMNEEPIYIAYTSSGFGYVGRSVYQRALYPLKSFIQTMITDDMVSRKAGVLIAKMKQAGSIIDNVMQAMAGIKRQLLKEASTDNVLSISTEEDIQTLNMQNVDGAGKFARDNILKNIGVAADMPAKILDSETFVEGFGEGSEDAKAIAQYIDGVRADMEPLYDFFDRIVMRRAWNPAFYATIQKEFPDEYGKKPYTAALYEWINAFTAKWPSLLTEPDSEKIKVDETKFKTVVAAVEVLLPVMDPENKARVVGWLADNLNENRTLFSAPLILDLEALRNYEPPQPGMGGAEPGQTAPDGAQEPKEPKPFAGTA